MLKLNELREIIKMLDKSTITEFDYEVEGLKIAIKKETSKIVHTVSPSVPSLEGQPIAYTPILTAAPAVAEVPAPAQAVEKKAEPAPEQNLETAGYHQIVSPMVGTFYSAPAPDAPPYVKKGDKVTESTVVCIVEAMKLMNELEAEVRGEIVDILVENGQLVEYGQPLFLVKPE